jgi:murein DD-endopeptidase MepM/ murein hydrolase activator NlpD
MHSQNQNLLTVPSTEWQVRATAHDSSPQSLSSGITRKTRHSATMLGLALSMGTAGWGLIYQTQQANAATSTVVPNNLVPSHLRLEEATLPEQKLKKTKTNETTVTRIRHLPNQNQFRAVNWASKSDRFLKQQQIMLQNLKEKREQLNTSLGKLKTKNLAIAHTKIGQPVSRGHISLTIETTPTTAIPQLPALTAPQTISDNERQIYQVQAGDTLEIIARRYNTTRKRLIEANKLNNPNLIFVAQQLQIPVIEPSKNPSKDNLSDLPPANLSNLKTSKQTPVATEFDSTRSISSNTNSSKSRNSIVSTAPSSVENYNQMFRIPVGESVAPELPPLSSPDRYLPSGNSSQSDGYIWPSVGVITSGYGWRWGRMHRGIDIAGPIGTPIVAAAAGEVVSAGWSSGGYGNLVEVKHGDGSITLYAHNNKILVRRGQWVEQGEQIAEMGSTGYSTGPHLHFEIRPDGETTANPIAFLPKN